MSEYVLLKPNWGKPRGEKFVLCGGLAQFHSGTQIECFYIDDHEAVSGIFAKNVEAKDDRQVLLELKEYIENSEKTFSAEFGAGHDVATIIQSGEMPDVYAYVLNRLSALEGK